MNAPLQIAVAVTSVAVLLGLMAVVKHFAARFGLRAEVQRKLVHIGTGFYALTLPWLFPERWPVFMLIGLTLAVMLVLRLPRFAKGGIGETLHGVERKSWGDLLLALAVGVVFLLSDGRAVLYVLPIAILTLSDAAAALTGSRYGSRFFAVEAGQKSLEGSVAFFMVTLILSMVCLLLLSDVSRPNVILLALIVAAFGTLVEADSWRGFDNFFLPAGLMVFLEVNLDRPPVMLLWLALGFAGAVWISLGLAARLGLTHHAARVYVISAFLLVSVTTLPNAVLPLLVFAAHWAACRARPCRAEFPPLDAVAALALLSFGWLALGALTGINGRAFYGMHAMGFALGLVALCGRGWITALAGVALLALYRGLMGMNVVGGWEPLLWPFAGLAVLAAALPLARPALFDDHRAARLALVSLAAPLLAFAAIWGAR